jgi:ribonuclease BN (tRNA processing enzyme)
VQVGGHTSCLAITCDGDTTPSLVLDAGTGIREVSALLDGAPFRGTILLSHLHWDHTQGLPFFGAADHDDAIVRVLLPADEEGDTPTDGCDGALLLARAMSPPHFPIGPTGLHGAWTFGVIGVGERVLEHLQVRSAEVTHKGGTTLGHRMTDRTGSLVYLPDHAAADPSRRGDALALAADADVLVHDAQFAPGESLVAHRYGHSTVHDAVAFAIDAGVAELVLFHHGPARTDTEVQELLELARLVAGDRLTVSLAIEGRELVPGR